MRRISIRGFPLAVVLFALAIAATPSGAHAPRFEPKAPKTDIAPIAELERLTKLYREALEKKDLASFRVLHDEQGDPSATPG